MKVDHYQSPNVSILLTLKIYHLRTYLENGYMLIALSRASDLHLLDIQHMQSQLDKVKFSVVGLRYIKDEKVLTFMTSQVFKACGQFQALSSDISSLYVDRMKDKHADKEFKF